MSTSAPDLTTSPLKPQQRPKKRVEGLVSARVNSFQSSEPRSDLKGRGSTKRTPSPRPPPPAPARRLTSSSVSRSPPPPIVRRSLGHRRSAATDSAPPPPPPKRGSAAQRPAKGPVSRAGLATLLRALEDSSSHEPPRFDALEDMAASLLEADSEARDADTLLAARRAELNAARRRVDKAVEDGFIARDAADRSMRRAESDQEPPDDAPKWLREYTKRCTAVAEAKAALETQKTRRISAQGRLRDEVARIKAAGAAWTASVAKARESAAAFQGELGGAVNPATTSDTVALAAPPRLPRVSTDATTTTAATAATDVSDDALLDGTSLNRDEKRRWGAKVSTRRQQTRSLSQELITLSRSRLAEAASECDDSVRDEATQQPFASLVYHCDEVQLQIDAGVHMLKRAKKFMLKVISWHREFADTIERATNEEKQKVVSRKPGDRMNLCRDAFVSVLNQSEAMSACHRRLADQIQGSIMTPLLAFFEVSSKLSVSTQTDKEKTRRSLGQSFELLRKSERSTQHTIDEVLRLADRINTKVRANSGEGKQRSTFFGSSVGKSREQLKRVHVKALDAMRAHRKLCAEVSTRQQKYLDEEMPSILERMQSLEEMRIEMFKRQSMSYAQCLEAFSDEYIKVVANITHFGELIDKDEDIRNFTRNCQMHKSLKLPDVTYALSKTPEEMTLEKLLSLERSSADFKSTLADIMKGQRKTAPKLAVPRAVATLTAAFERVGGLQTEGVFRVPAQKTSIEELRAEVAKEGFSVPDSTSPHIVAGCLKDYLRRLRGTLAPEDVYDRCVALGKADAVDQKGLQSVTNALPRHNRKLLEHLARLVAKISSPSNVPRTKMTLANLAMVFAPAIIQNPSTDPLAMLSSIKYEIRFVQRLLAYLTNTGVDRVSSTVSVRTSASALSPPRAKSVASQGSVIA